LLRGLRTNIWRSALAEGSRRRFRRLSLRPLIGGSWSGLPRPHGRGGERVFARSRWRPIEKDARLGAMGELMREWRALRVATEEHQMQKAVFRRPSCLGRL